MDLGGKVVQENVLICICACLNPCFGGFGWESRGAFAIKTVDEDVLILVLVDLGGKGDPL